MRKNLSLIILLSAISLSTIGCNSKKNSSSEQYPSKLQKEVQVTMDASLNSQVQTYSLSIKYDDDYFLNDAKTYDKGLSELSFGSAISTATKERISEFFKTLEFKDVALTSYDIDPTETTCGYTFAHKSINEYELVAISIRGFNYGKEWANNFLIGKTGNHEGFNARASEVYSNLQNYVSTYCANKTLKVWINGYSRGGAIANVLSSLMLQDNKLNVSKENMFTYTFEAPRCLTKENAVAYENVHNVINTCDFITSIPPVEYDLYRCGVDHEIYNANVSNIAKAFDQNISVPEFVPIEDHANNDAELVKYIFDPFFRKEDPEESVSANDRNHYVDNYQSSMSYMIGMVFSLRESTRAHLLADFQALDIFALSALIGDETGEKMADFFAPYLVLDSIAYDYDVLQGHSAVFTKLIRELGLNFIVVYATAPSNITRMIDMHYPEVAYSLLLNSHQ